MVQRQFFAVLDVGQVQAGGAPAAVGDAPYHRRVLAQFLAVVPVGKAGMVAQVVDVFREGQAAPFEVGGHGVACFQWQGAVPNAQEAVDLVAWLRRRRRGRFSPWGWCLPFPDA